MSVQISGVLKDGAGKPVHGCSIQLNAKKTSPTVVVEVISSTVTDANGHYSIEAEPGYYSVSLLREGFPPSVAGDIYVAPTDVPDTLNAFLDAPKDADLRPEVMKRFEEMVNRVVDLSGATEKDRERAEQARDEALTSRNEAVEAAETAATDAAEKAATDAAEKAAGKVSEQLKAAVADDTQRAEAAMAGAESAAAASQGYRDEARAAAAVATTKAGEASASAASADTARTAAAASAAEAKTSETIATQQAGKAATSATNAANSASAANTAKTDAEAARDAANTAKTGSEAARDAALDAQTAAELAEANAKISETNAAESKRLAEAARDAANSSAGIYQDTTSGLAGTATGGYFSVLSPLDDEVLILYRNDSGIATEVKRYPSAAGVENTRVSMIGVAAGLVLTQSIIAAHHAFL